VIVTGTFKLAALKPLLEKEFGDWKAGKSSAPAIGAPESTDARLIVVDRPGAPQTTLVCFSLGRRARPPTIRRSR